MRKRNIVMAALLGVLTLGLSLIVSGCGKTAEEEKGGSIAVVNTSNEDYYFGVFDPKNTNVHGATHSVRALGNKTVTVAKDDNYEIAYSKSSIFWSTEGRKYVNVSGGAKVTVEIP